MRKNFEKIYVIDTNIILNDAKSIKTLSNSGSNLIVLPETTIDELDNKKSGFEEINFQAREFGRMLSDAKVLDTHQVGNTKNVTIMEVEVANMIIHIISFKDYGLDGVDKSILNDRKIIKGASFAKNYYKNADNTYIISNDIMFRTRAISLNLKAQGLGIDKDIESGQYIKEIEIDSSLFNTIDNKDILEYDLEWKPENYCYGFLSPDGNRLYAYIVNRRINIIHDDLFKGCFIKPLNVEQRFAMAGMLDPRIDITYLEALAGSGKTIIALAAAMRLIDKGHYSKILYIRNSIESLDKGEDVGYLSGNEEKFQIYNYPLYDSLEFLSRASMRKKNEKLAVEAVTESIQNMIRKYQIECLWIGALRGRSLDDAVVIQDEFQNMSPKSSQTTLTRLGNNCKVFITGSNNQIDNLYINKHTNASAFLTKALKEQHDNVNLFATSLSKVVRGKITEFAEKIFTKQ